MIFVGWGDTVASDTWSRIYTILYTIIGVPIVFSAYANVGKLIDRTYCADWIFQTMVVRHKVIVRSSKNFLLSNF